MGVVVTEEVLAVELQEVGDPKELLEEALKDALLPLRLLWRNQTLEELVRDDLLVAASVRTLQPDCASRGRK